MKKKNLASTLLLTLLQAVTYPIQAFANQSNDEKEKFFSLNEIQSSERKELMPLEFIKASDGVPLAFRAYRPSHAKAILIFYHGAGAHSGLLYNHIGIGLRDGYQIGVYMPDVRGHGHSGGDRGDAPSKEQVWNDISEVVNHVRTLHPEVPIFLGGHSAGAGLVLNYSSWELRENIEGYALIAPYLGFRSKTNREHDGENYQFSTVNVAKFIINSITQGLLFSHSKAVEFNFPESVVTRNPEIVTFNTVTMSNAVTPGSPSTQLYKLKRFSLWIGDEDEAFEPSKVAAFAESNSHKYADKDIGIIDGANHFSIILESAELIGPWILSKSK